MNIFNPDYFSFVCIHSCNPDVEAYKGLPIVFQYHELLHRTESQCVGLQSEKSIFVSWWYHLRCFRKWCHGGGNMSLGVCFHNLHGHTISNSHSVVHAAGWGYEILGSCYSTKTTTKYEILPHWLHLQFLCSMNFRHNLKHYNDVKRLYHITFIEFLSNNFLLCIERLLWRQSLYNTLQSRFLSLGYVLFYVFRDYYPVKRLYHTDYIHRASL